MMHLIVIKETNHQSLMYFSTSKSHIWQTQSAKNYIKI